ncbi:XRE family transcriptional regulator [bacterium]|nr:MAG: XRE family transcriptional regulator [bacterium]
MTSADAPDLGSSLRRLRRARGWRLEEASRQIGVSAPALSTWENGGRRPRTDTLARLLDALEAEPREKARLLHLVDPLSSKILLARSPLGSPVSVGMVLRVMRRRRGISQSDFARRIGVSQAAVSHWESGDTAPSVEAIHAIGFALDATVEETLALASAEGGGDGRLSHDPEVARAQIWDSTLPRSIQETIFLGWEAELWRRAGRDRRWDPLLISVIAARTNWLAGEERFSEIAAPAHRAIRLATTVEGRVEAVPAIAALADADRHLGRGHAAAIELAQGWKAHLPDSMNKSWLLVQLGMSLARQWETETAVGLLNQAVELEEAVANTQADEHAWVRHAMNICEGYLAAGEPRKAAAFLGGRRGRKFRPATFVEIEHANGRPVTEAEMAYLRHWFSRLGLEPAGQREFASLERRQAQLKGGKTEPVEPVPTDPEAEDRLWAAVLRDHPG